VGDNLVKIVDSLTKQTGQIVELAKLKQKAAGPTLSEDGLDSETRDSLYDAIEGSDDEEAVKDFS
jgi:hypothetical protein